MGKKFYNNKATKETVPVEEVKEETKVIFEDPNEVEPLLPAEVCNVDVSLNIRVEPKVEPNNQVGILSKGSKLFVMDNAEVVESDGTQWYKVKFGDPLTGGYAMMKYVKLV